MYIYTSFFLPFLSIYLGFNFQTVIPGHPLSVITKNKSLTVVEESIKNVSIFALQQSSFLASINICLETIEIYCNAVPANHNKVRKFIFKIDRKWSRRKITNGIYILQRGCFYHLIFQEITE